MLHNFCESDFLIVSQKNYIWLNHKVMNLVMKAFLELANIYSTR